MGCTSESLYYVSRGWVVREHRLYESGHLASESILGARLNLA